MSDPDDELPFEGMTVPQRHRAALKHTTAVAKELVPFLRSILRPAHPPDRKLQREAVDRGLEEARALLSTLLLNHLLAAGFIYHGPPPPVDDSDDARNLRAIQEVHFRLDWLAKIAPSDSVDAVRADFKRLEQGQEPLTLRRDKYVDRRRRDPTERLDREFAVLFVFYLAAKGDEKPHEMLQRLGIGIGRSAFEKWMTPVPREHRDLMTAAGVAERKGEGLPLEQQTLLMDSPRCLAVLNRDDATLFPDLAGLSDEDKVRKLFDRVQRRGHFARSAQQKPPTRPKSSGQIARKPQKKLKKTGRNVFRR